MQTLPIEGVRGQVLTRALCVFRDALGKQKKKDEETFGLDTEQHEQFDGIAEAMLGELGWKPRKKGTSSDAPSDPTQMDFTKDQSAMPTPRGARVKCLGCTRSFAVPHGADVLRRCPDCAAIHQVSADEEGTVFKLRHLVQPPDDVLALLLRSKDKQLAKLLPKEKRALDAWLNEHPDHMTNAELVERGDRVADPEVPGSGNALRIVCRAVTGVECEGFDATDTPGAALCPSCGQKYVVELVAGDALVGDRVLVRSWSIDDEAEARGE